MNIEESKLIRNLTDLIESKGFVDHLSVDCTIFGFHKNHLKVLLVKYHEVDLWATPGGFVFEDEDLDEAASRVLFERTNLENIFLEQFFTFGKRDRTRINTHQLLLKMKGIEVPKDHWIYQRFITVGYCSLIDYTLAPTFPGSTHESCEWFDVDQLPTLAFDHEEIIEKGLDYIRKNLDTNIVASKLLPEKFTMKDLQHVYETVHGDEFQSNNFQRKMLSLNILERLEKHFTGSANKAPYLYRFLEK